LCYEQTNRKRKKDITMANETNEQKRERTSPRTNAFEQAMDAIKKVAADDGTLDDAIEAVRSLIGTKVEPPKYEGTNYVAVFANGARVPFKSSARPSQRSHGAQFAKVMGPWRKADEAGYKAALSGDESEAPVVFEIVAPAPQA
jgi:hypothetical protein